MTEPKALTRGIERGAELAGKTAAAARAAATRCSQNLEPIASEVSEKVNSFGRKSRASVRRMSAVMAESGSEAASAVADRVNSFGQSGRRSLSFNRNRKSRNEPPAPPPLDGPTVPPDIPWATGDAGLPPPPAGLWSNQQSSSVVCIASAEAAVEQANRRREARQQRRRQPAAPPATASSMSVAVALADEEQPLPPTQPPLLTKKQSSKLLAFTERELAGAQAELVRQRSTVEEYDTMVLTGLGPAPTDAPRPGLSRPGSRSTFRVEPHLASEEVMARALAVPARQMRQTGLAYEDAADRAGALEKENEELRKENQALVGKVTALEAQLSALQDVVAAVSKYMPVAALPPTS